MPKKVVIIGGGIAGISAAVGLAEQGHKVTLIVSRNTLGGRVYSFLDSTTGEQIDNGQHAMMGAYSNFIKLLKILGTDGHLVGNDNLRVPFCYKDGFTDVLDVSGNNPQIAMLKGLFGLKRLSLKSKLLTLFFFAKLKFGLIKSEGFTVHELLKKNFQTDEMIEKFWEPLVLAILNSSPYSASANLLLEVLKRAFLSDKQSSRLLFSDVGLSSLLASFPDWLTRNGGKIIFGKSVKKFEIANNRITKIILADEIISDFDYVISAIQPNALKKLISENENEKENFNYLNQFEYSPIVSVYLWLDKEITLEKFIAFLGTKTQWLFNLNHIKKRDIRILEKFPGHYALTISGADDIVELTAEKIVKMVLKEITSSLKLQTIPEVLHYRVFKDKFATFKANPKTEKIRPDSLSSINNLLLAGDWTNTGLPATIEGAAQSGFRASEII